MVPQLILWPASAIGIEYDGDSISNPSFVTPSSAGYYNVAYSIPLFPTGVLKQNDVAVGGEKVATMAANLPGSISADIAAIHAAGRKAVAWVFGGTNDLANPTYPSATQAQVIAAWTSYASGARAAGVDYVVPGGILPRGIDGSSNPMPAGFETDRQALNLYVRNNYRAMGFDDFSFIGEDPNFNNIPTVFGNILFGGDETHPLPAGHDILANYHVAAVMRIGSTAKITRLSVNSGPQAGGTTVTIQGNGGYSDLAYPPIPIVCGLRCTNVTIVSDTQLTCKTAAFYGTGTAHVMVLTKYGTATLLDAFTVTP